MSKTWDFACWHFFKGLSHQSFSLAFHLKLFFTICHALYIFVCKPSCIVRITHTRIACLSCSSACTFYQLSCTHLLHSDECHCFHWESHSTSCHVSHLNIGFHYIDLTPMFWALKNMEEISAGLGRVIWQHHYVYLIENLSVHIMSHQVSQLNITFYSVEVNLMVYPPKFWFKKKLAPYKKNTNIQIYLQYTTMCSNYSPLSSRGLHLASDPFLYCQFQEHHSTGKIIWIR